MEAQPEGHIMTTTKKYLAALALAALGFVVGVEVNAAAIDVADFSTAELFTELEDRGVVHD
jgi:hypothetical protein